MKNQISFKKKIDLLMISLEVLNTYYINNSILLEFNHLRKDLRNCHDNITHNFTQIIKYIYVIHKITNKYLLHKTAIQILINCINNKNKKIPNIKQYIKKFNYIYSIKHEYYNNYKSIHHVYKINIENIAIINLYLITKLVNKQGIYFLIKYLFK
uniref:Uncharacterized protein n=1 Tax=Thaumatella adunca TaxID=2006976 RepID=A0A1Z1MP26_9FLOR|nr:hypothetical protein [Thaumatella adunca]ARW67535.1 hypothetical protein [Thaumatella adunca]